MNAPRPHSPNRSVILPIAGERIPPQNIECEREIIGALFIDPGEIVNIAEILKPEDFYRDDFGEIYRAMLDLFHAGAPIDPAAVAELLERRGNLGRVGGYETLVEALGSWAPHAAQAVYHAHTVKDKARKRAVIDLANETLKAAYSHESTADELESVTIDSLLKLAADSKSRTARNMKQAVAAGMERIDAFQEGRFRGIKSGLEELDTVINGFSPGTLTVIGARPSQGKSALGHLILENAVVNLPGNNAILFSLEMDHASVMLRMIASRARVDSHRIMQPNTLTDDERQRLVKASEELSVGKLITEDIATITVNQICIAVLKANARTPVSMVVIDYLQKIEASEDGRPGNREREVAKISNRLQSLARSTGCAVILIAQLNRNTENRDDKRPRMADLRESGSIEQDADTVLLLHHPEDRPGVADIIIAKNRNGRTGVVSVAWYKQFARFDNLPDEDVPDPEF